MLGRFAGILDELTVLESILSRDWMVPTLNWSPGGGYTQKRTLLWHFFQNLTLFLIEENARKTMLLNN